MFERRQIALMKIVANIFAFRPQETQIHGWWIIR